MAEAARVETVPKSFADVTSVIEDATLIAAEGQATPDLASARRSCDRLIAQLEPCLGRLQRLRRRIG